MKRMAESEVGRKMQAIQIVEHLMPFSSSQALGTCPVFMIGKA